MRMVDLKNWITRKGYAWAPSKGWTHRGKKVRGRDVASKLDIDYTTVLAVEHSFTRELQGGSRYNPSGGKPEGESVGKIKVKEVWLNRAEGPRGQTGERTVGSLEQADKVLKDWALTAPKPRQGYDKTDFMVTFADGETYEGRYDLVYEDHKKKSLLGNHIQDFVLFHAGLRRPEHLTMEQYASYIEDISHAEGPSQQDYLEFLQKYEL